MTYQINPVAFSVKCDTQVTFPAPIRYMLISVWVKRNQASYYLTIGGLSSWTGIQINTGDNGCIQFGDGVVHNVANYTCPVYTGGWEHYLWSMDMARGTFQVYINDIAQTVLRVPPHAKISLSSGGLWLGATMIDVTGAHADLYVSSLNSFYDLTIEANRRKFIDLAGFPVDLGADGSIPTGTSPELFLTTSLTDASDYLINKGHGNGTFSTTDNVMFWPFGKYPLGSSTYQINPINFSATNELTFDNNSNPVLDNFVNFPTSFRYALMSAWVQRHATGASFMLGTIISAGGIQIVFNEYDFASGNFPSCSVQYFSTTSTTGQVFAWYHVPLPDNTGTTWEHVLISIDSVGQGDVNPVNQNPLGVIQFYVNDVVISRDLPPTHGINNDSLDSMTITTPSGKLSMSFAGGNSCFADIYFTTLDSFYDLSIEANRRKFIDPSGKPVDLGTDGSLPTGIIPQFFATARESPADYLINRGSGGGVLTTADNVTVCGQFLPASTSSISYYSMNGLVGTYEQQSNVMVR